ncbi:anti-sigma factor RsbA family regulatory protein [Microbispora sp. NPDC049125]|uniref:anti-sigma factor RsbA family regulatory protein n=1 Tax=Microbispora sp. NPDC049125 TaxID=3154929 RepID=UPI003465F772
MTRMIHQAALYGSDAEFLAMAVTFVRDGLERGEPVLVTTTSGNLTLLGEALGDEAGRVDYAESAYFGRRTALRATGFLRYWQRNAGHERVRILAEPVWAGRSPRDVLAWKRMESGLNLILEGTGIWMICPYDTRTAGPGIVADAMRTHPSLSSDGRRISASPAYADPVTFIGECDAAPLPEAPATAVSASLGDLQSVRRFVTGQAGRSGLTGERVTMLALAAHEASRYLETPLTARMWETFGALVCDLRADREIAAGPLAGFTPPGLEERPEDGLWVARQICDHVDIRTGGGSCTVRLQTATWRLQESA